MRLLSRRPRPTAAVPATPRAWYVEGVAAPAAAVVRAPRAAEVTTKVA